MAKPTAARRSGGHKVVSRRQWTAARKALLVKEKKFSRQRERLAEERRRLPWVKVDQGYVFDGPEGPRSLAQLFGTKNQLVVYHFMFGPGWKEGCPHCSFWADHYDGMLPHLGQRDVSCVAISRAPLTDIRPFQGRMGWRFKWVSSAGNDFNYDFQVSFRPEEIQTGKVLLPGLWRIGLVGDREVGGISERSSPGRSIPCKPRVARPPRSELRQLAYGSQVQSGFAQHEAHLLVGGRRQQQECTKGNAMALRVWRRRLIELGNQVAPAKQLAPQRTRAVRLDRKIDQPQHAFVAPMQTGRVSGAIETRGAIHLVRDHQELLFLRECGPAHGRE
jgi:predicted dithiol-disulfide oxidoreductase (DUF899 family)